MINTSKPCAAPSHASPSCTPMANTSLEKKPTIAAVSALKRKPLGRHRPLPLLNPNPYRLTTTPPLITNPTRSTTVMSSSGLPGTAMTSAKYPAFSCPTLFCHVRICAPFR